MFEKFHRGDIYSADLSPGIGSEQSGSRPVLILQNNVGNCFSPTIIIAAITSVSKKSRKFPTHYHLNDRCGLVKPSVVMLEMCIRDRYDAGCRIDPAIIQYGKSHFHCHPRF